MVDQIIFHVGAPKTGSTYLQKRILQNKEALQSRGICYPTRTGFERIAANAKLINYGIDPEKATEFRKAFPAVDVGQLDPTEEFNALLSKCPSDTKTVILSSEGMLPRYAPDLARFVPTGPQTTIVLCVRRQDSWIDSFFNQEAKKNRMNSIDDVVDLALNGGNETLCQPDWWQHYQNWSANFERCEVLFFDQKTPSFWDSFAQVAGFEPDAMQDIDRANESLSPMVLLYLACLPSAMPRAEFMIHRKAAQKLAQPIDLSPKKFSMISRAARADLRARFEAGNDRLQKHFGITGNPLYIAPEAAHYIDPRDLINSVAFKDFQQTVQDAVQSAKAS